jgi:Family of unknown function (DUF5372)
MERDGNKSRKGGFSALISICKKVSTASHCNVHDTKFTITHPFHPLYEQEFELVTYYNLWGDKRVTFIDKKGELISIPMCWTSLNREDPYVKISSGRSCFRVEDLVNLRYLIDTIMSDEVKEEDSNEW